jgi:hypothetical protein
LPTAPTDIFCLNDLTFGCGFGKMKAPDIHRFGINRYYFRRKGGKTMKNMKFRVRGLVAALLTISLAATAMPVFAISDEDMGRLARQYADPDSQEWQDFRKAWSDYFLDFMPTENEPELLELLKTVPAENDVAGWHEFFQYGDPDLMYQELKRVTAELDLRNPNLSLKEKDDRIHDWIAWGDFIYGPFGWGSGGKTHNGYEYDCKTVAFGYMALFRIAGMSATNVSMVVSNRGHTEAFYFLNNEWRRVKGRSNWAESFGLDDSRIRESMAIEYNANAKYKGKEAVAVGWPRSIDDINESWIDVIAETFMGTLIQRPLAYPERTLTRGEVAKLVCNYLGIVPMRNESTFSDVPATHKYVRYIWAMNKTGIMSGDASGTFRPDSTLSMQEFAVIATRILNYGKSNSGTDPAKLEPSATENTPKTFIDADKIAAWAKPAVDEFSRFGILQGDNNGRLNPAEPLDKIRFLVFMQKFDMRFGLFTYDGGGISQSGDLQPLF